MNRFMSREKNAKIDYLKTHQLLSSLFDYEEKLFPFSNSFAPTLPAQWALFGHSLVLANIMDGVMCEGDTGMLSNIGNG